MEESAPKRRRVSSRLSGGTPEAQASSIATPQSEASLPRKKRPSYASPTKSSLARHNPDIFERRRSKSPSKPPSPSKAAEPTRVAGAGGELGASIRLQAITAHIPASEPNVDDRDAEEGDISAPAERPSTESRGLSAPPRRSPSKPNPRPLPPPAPDGEDEINPFMGKTIRRSADTGLPIPLPPEPELPPAVEDPVSSTPPRGIHSSPRWRDKSKPRRSSPLKPKDNRPAEEVAQLAQPSKLNFGRSAEGSEPIIPVSQYANATNEARKVPIFDGTIDKKKERDALRTQLEALRKDLEIANRENDRIRATQSSNHTAVAINDDEVLSLIKRTLIPSDESSRVTQSSQLMKAALNPMSLLPFAKPTPIARVSRRNADDFSDVKSHYPVTMTADEELPYLQLFSPFTITSTIAVLPSEPKNMLRQRRLVTLKSRDTPGIFTARLSMVINAMNLAILELSLEALEPSAKPELSPFVEKICSGDCNRSMKMNIGIVTWAMGEWYRVAVQRAGFWAQLDRELATKDGILEVATKMRTREANEEELPESTSCSRAELIRFIGQQSYEVKVPVNESTAGSSIRLEWKISFDWTGEARSKLGAKIGVPGREADQRGVLGKLPALFETLVEDGEPARAVRTLVSLLFGE